MRGGHAELFFEEGGLAAAVEGHGELGEERGAFEGGILLERDRAGVGLGTGCGEQCFHGDGRAAVGWEAEGLFADDGALLVAESDGAVDGEGDPVNDGDGAVDLVGLEEDGGDERHGAEHGLGCAVDGVGGSSGGAGVFGVGLGRSGGLGEGGTRGDGCGERRA